jgi:hypothetical protein
MTHINLRWVAFGIALCACTAETPTAMTIQPGINMQGINMQGINMQGINMQGMAMHGFLVDGATLGGAPLQNVHVERGEVVAQIGNSSRRGTDLVGAHFFAEVRNITQTPSLTSSAEYRVTAISTEDSQYDPTSTGNTYLYTLEQWVPDTATWQPACGPDYDGRNVAIPLAAIWDEHGDRSVSSAMFTFGCTTGVIAKCYRWGYRPWVTGYGDLAAMHWTCTRAARADYCGNGTPHTHDGTKINVWDRLPAPGPIQSHGGLLPPLGMLFEAGWNTGGAVCLSHARWLLDPGGLLAAACPNRLVAPSLPLIGGTVCDLMSEVVGYDPNAMLFNEAYLNLGP